MTDSLVSTTRAQVLLKPAPPDTRVSTHKAQVLLRPQSDSRVSTNIVQSLIKPAPSDPQVSAARAQALVRAIPDSQISTFKAQALYKEIPFGIYVRTANSPRPVLTKQTDGKWLPLENARSIFANAMAVHPWTTSRSFISEPTYKTGLSNWAYTNNRWMLAYDAAMNNAVYTVLVVARTNTIGKTIAGRYNESVTAQRCWALDLAGGSGKLQVRTLNTGGTLTFITSTAGYADSNYHVYVMTFNASKTLITYVDGVQVGGSATMTGTPTNPTANEPIYVRSRSATETFANTWYGDVDWFGYLAGTALTQAEALALYNAWIQ